MIPKASVIIRTRNEERWIAACLRSVMAQDYGSFEVILVDNQSTDRTVARASAFDVSAMQVEDYLPGRALNAGIRKSTGDILVCLSGHCIPASRSWLRTLVAGLDDPSVAGVYGRQQPLSYSSASDKRDLLTIFGLDRRVQRRDSFFHNANSAIPRRLWEQVPFDETVTNIEDRVWAKRMIEMGYLLVYEPDASVYHYHGIHQDGNPERARNVVQIIESLNIEGMSVRNHIDVQQLHVTAIVPTKGPIPQLAGRPLLDYTLQRAREATLVKEIVVATDDDQCESLARAGGAVAIRRPAELSADYVDIDEVLQYTLEQLEGRGPYPDLVVLLGITFPFREPGFIDRMIRHLVETGADSVLPAHREYRSCWVRDGATARRIDTGFAPREYKEPVYIGLRSLGFVTHPSLIREGQSLGEKVALLDVADAWSAIEVRDATGLYLGERLVPEYFAEDTALSTKPIEAT
jgi:rhamnosyltransferase